MAALKLHAKHESPEAAAAEIDAAFSLFTRGDEAITLQHLRRVARELREDVGDEVLRDMLREANGGVVGANGDGAVGRGEFEEVMRRAGVFA